MNKEIGSFIELDIFGGTEYYSGNNVLALNTARAAIYHACKVPNTKTIHLPFYLCPSVKKFLQRKEIEIKFYNINSNFEPVNVHQEDNESILIVNYFGIISPVQLQSVALTYKNVIIDNSQSFFLSPIENCYNVYSPRKFFGVPDGAYLIGNNASIGIDEYEQDFSSDTSIFLLKRIEYGSSAVYAERMKNEERLDNLDIKLMSKLTSSLLKGIDYKYIKGKRIENFQTAHDLFKDINLLDFDSIDFEKINPMVYPLMIEDAELVQKLNEISIYTGRWWNDVLNFVPENSFEAGLSKYMLPIPIDQRYGQDELAYINKQIRNILSFN
jgi:hypothetical protein